MWRKWQIWRKMGKVAKEFGLDVIKIYSEWGTPLIQTNSKILEEDKSKEIKAVILTHSETSTV